MAEIKDFKDLLAWKKSHEVMLFVYRETKQFPSHELFSLVNQMRRVAISVTSNIAEGFGRRTLPEKIRFYDIAIGSLYELQSQIIAAKDLGYLSEQNYNQLELETTSAQKLLNGLISSLQKIQI